MYFYKNFEQMKTLLLTLLGLFTLYAPLNAQKIFSEGQIKYDVYINGSTKPEGVFVISVKGGMIKREISMNNGYHNITLYNHQTGMTHSLSLKGDQKYALEMKAEEVKLKNKRFEGAKIDLSDEQKKLAGLKCQDAEVTYLNGEKAKFSFTTELIPMIETFNAMFPGLKGIPLEYEVKSSPTLNMKFVATLIDIKAIDASIFQLPADYKIVTTAELESMK
jgi:hypothetical protein